MKFFALSKEDQGNCSDRIRCQILSDSCLSTLSRETDCFYVQLTLSMYVPTSNIDDVKCSPIIYGIQHKMSPKRQN